jgi:predicted nucleic acid-binding protein
MPARPGEHFEASFDAEDDVVVFRRLPPEEGLAGRSQAMPSSDGRPAAPEPGDAKGDLAMSWLLDADVLSQPAKRKGDPRVIAWMEREKETSYTSSIVIAQLAYWVRTKTGRKREALQSWLSDLIEALEGRIYSFNVSAAHVWADQKLLLEKAGNPMPVEDGYIVAIARRHGLTIVTGNDADFRRPGLKVFNPFKELTAGTEE